MNKNCGGCMGKMCASAKIVKIFLIVGGLNWGLVGLGGFLGMNLNIVNLVLGGWPMVESIVYLLVGVAAVMKIFGGCKCKTCMPEDMMQGMPEENKMM